MYGHVHPSEGPPISPERGGVGIIARGVAELERTRLSMGMGVMRAMDVYAGADA